MLELRPTCEHCNAELDPTSDEAPMCTYECTFCARCATWELLGICPNCMGELVTRPRRPAAALANDPASKAIVHRPVDIAHHQAAVRDRLVAGDLPEQTWSVIFVSGRPADARGDGYGTAAADMETFARAQPGFLAVESARTITGDEALGITVSRWSSIAAMVSWRSLADHRAAQQAGRDCWYDSYRSDVARVDRSTEFSRR